VALTSWEDIKAWRQSTRKELLARRLALNPRGRRGLGRSAYAHLLRALDDRFDVIGIYWPIRSEIDIRALAKAHLASGGRVALPVIVQKAAPLEFWRWQPGMKMDRGVWDIPVPALREPVQPDVLIAPLVGFDRCGFRLGYGGGYFDRTLAAASPRPYCIGIGYSETQLQTIHPQPHDIRMDAIVTDREIVTHSPLQRPYRSPACLADTFNPRRS